VTNATKQHEQQKEQQIGYV